MRAESALRALSASSEGNFNGLVRNQVSLQTFRISSFLTCKTVNKIDKRFTSTTSQEFFKVRLIK